ncbi:hypothetical protein [Jeotgalibaca sp. A127]|uniref:hypothetical protein n=1 Tax=Jeotgalibaca sp. A127 TaxID=3457324 RepID=UPI003FD63B2B
MDFTKIVALNRPTENLVTVELTDAQIEAIIVAGLAAPIPEELYNKFHITFYSEEENKKGPVNIVVSLKDGEELESSKYLFAGMIMAQMQLATTNLLLGYQFITDEAGFINLSTPDKKQEIGIPDNYTPIQQLRVGYPEHKVDTREMHGLSTLMERFG